MAMTEDQNASIRAYAATNPSEADLAAAKAMYNVSDADYANALAGGHRGIGDTYGNPAGYDPYQDAQAALAAAPTVIIGGGGSMAGMAPLPAAPNATPPISINPATSAPVGPLTTVPGVSTGSTTPRPAQHSPFQPQPAQPFHTPMLDALYQGQQQRMTSPAPSFNFQAKPAFKDGGSVGALSRVIKHGL